MEERAVADHPSLLHEGDAALAYHLVEVFDGPEVAIDQRLIHERPQMLGGLQLGTMGRLDHEADAVGHGEVLGSVPAGIVELQHDALLGPRADRFGEVGEHAFEVGLGDVVGDVPHRAAGRGLDEARYIEPLEAMMAERNGTLADRRPHAARDRLQADAMLVRRPDLDLCVGMLALLGRGGSLELFLSRARSCSVAARGCCGRGCWIE